MEIERMDSSRVTVRLRVRSARHVELSGEPTSWQAIPMRRVGGEWWEAEVHARPGSYRMNIRVDGKEWSAPPGSVATRDEFGGEVGVIVIK